MATHNKIDFTVRLENWFTTYPYPYLAPEVQSIVLQGKIYGHPRIEDGHEVVTPRIVEANGTRITVEGGHGTDRERYEVLLGEIEPGFREWLRENRPNWDPENPVTVFRSDDNSPSA